MDFQVTMVIELRWWYIPFKWQEWYIYGTWLGLFLVYFWFIYGIFSLHNLLWLWEYVVMRKHDEYIHIYVVVKPLYIYIIVGPLNGLLNMCSDRLWILALMSASHLMWFKLICIAYKKRKLWFTTMRNGNDEK